jgi:putative endonuclease
LTSPFTPNSTVVTRLDRATQYPRGGSWTHATTTSTSWTAASGARCKFGVTNDLIRRVFEHKSKIVESFTEKYDVVKLVYFEQVDDPENAIKREKRLKKWPRAWKISLIEKDNPDWNDLYPEIAAGGG